MEQIVEVQNDLKKSEVGNLGEQVEKGDMEMELNSEEEFATVLETQADGHVPMEENKDDSVPIMTNAEKEETRNIEVDVESDSYEMFLDDSDSEQASISDNCDEPNTEAPLTDAEIEELLAEFLEIESKAAEAQESLEKESLAKVESEVRLELSESLQGDTLELAVSSEMEAFKEQWEAVLDDLETQSSILLEQLDGAGIELPSIYKWIESQIPNICRTEAWKRRAHWVGSQATNEVDQSVKTAEQYLQSCRPVRKKHGRLLEEGASGFLVGKLSRGDNNPTENYEKSWTSFNDLIQSQKCSEGTSFGTSNWASVYLASTPQQAVNLGLKLPGIDEVEEIGEIEGDDADAINTVNEIELSEEQKRKYRKVREEDDVNLAKRLQHHLKQRRKRSKKCLEPVMSPSNECCEPTSPNPTLLENGVANVHCCDKTEGKSEYDPPGSNAAGCQNPVSNHSSMHSSEEEHTEGDNKRCIPVTIDSDDGIQMADNKYNFHVPSGSHSSPIQIEKAVDVIDLVSPIPTSRRKEHSRTFRCTVCSKVLKAPEVHRHPILEVVICGYCKFLVVEKNRLEDPHSGVYCSWCGKSEELLSCKSCTMLFCTVCVLKNFGEQCLSEVKATGWQCCCCSPRLLQQLISECEKALNGLESSSSESDSDLPEAENSVVAGKRRRKKRIRRILDDAELGEETKSKLAVEKARQEHLKSMQEHSAGKVWSKNIGDASEAVAEVIEEDAREGYIVNVAREKDEEPVSIPSSMSLKLKPHQVAGIRFMWENVIQSAKKVKSGDAGLGCILAHTMGLGKTFQVIAFLYTAMRSVDLGLRRALVVTPVNVLHNWKKEFIKWRPSELKPLRIYMLEDVARVKRAYLLSRWRAKGGVFLIGYASFRNLSLGRHVKDRNDANEIGAVLQYGPDILVCDEAHMIKNRRADITLALKQVKTQRRIALTGSPLQNNLMEYYCMVDFVREGYLGNSHEFRNRFQNPIENGQHTNSTTDDVKIMNQRSHILYEQLKGFVQRMDMNVVKKDLPPKTVFVITVKLSPLQRKLYKKFLDVHGFTNSKVSSEKSNRISCFFAGYQTLAQIWNHPGLLHMAKEQRDHLRREDAVENFLADGTSSDDTDNDVLNGEKQRTKSESLPRKSNNISYEENKWWEDLLDEKIYKEVNYSGKMVLLLDILSMSSEWGDKALVFSQSLTTLDLIELYLSKMPQKAKEGKYWKQGKDWYRIDGSTPCSERQNLVERFNEPTNRRVKCTLISTRAGSLGINLHAANRVIVVDGSWNPTYDLQAIYRVWRYGQNKPVYAYRLMAHGTMEEKIYKRQVTKEGLAARVVDRQVVHRTMSREEMLHLFEFGDEDVTEQNKEGLSVVDGDKSAEVGHWKEQKSVLNYQEVGRSDELMLNLLSRHYPRWVANYHEHETLLQENESERLTKEEQEMAWLTFRRSLEWEEVHRTVFDHPERKPVTNDFPSQKPIPPQQSKGSSKSRPTNPRKCSNLAHLLTLRSSGTKSGGSTTCGECGQEVSWETLNRDGRSR